MTRISPSRPFEISQTPAALSQAQLQGDAAFAGLCSQTTQFSVLSGYAAANLLGLAFRNAFLAAKPFASAWLNAGGAQALGVAAEAAFLTGISPGHSEESGPALAEFRSHLINLSCMRITGALLHAAPAALRHSSASFAQMAAHHLALAAGWEAASPNSLFGEFIEAEIRNLQFDLGNSLLHGFTGHRLASFRQGLEREGMRLQCPQRMRPLRMHSDAEPSNGGQARLLRRTQFHPFFEACWEKAPLAIRQRALRAILLVAEGNQGQGMNKKKIRGADRGEAHLFQVRVSDRYRLLFTRRAKAYEFIFLGAHNETDRIIRQWNLNPLQESQHAFNPFLAASTPIGEEPAPSPHAPRSAEEWAAHWAKAASKRDSRPTPAPEGPLEVEEASAFLADPARVLEGRIDVACLTEFPELGRVSEAELLAFSEACPWRGDPHARTLLHFQALRVRLQPPELLRAESLQALSDLDEIFGASTAADDPREMASLAAEAYRTLHPYDRLRLQAETSAWESLGPAEIEHAWLTFMLDRQWHGEHLDRLVEASLQHGDSPRAFAQWILAAPSRPLRSPARQVQRLEEAREAMHQRFPEMDFFGLHSDAPLEASEYERWGIEEAARPSWNEAPAPLRRLLRGYEDFLGARFTAGRFGAAIRHLSVLAPKGGPAPLWRDHAWDVLSRARGLEDREIRTAFQSHPMKCAEACEEIAEHPFPDTLLPAENRDARRFFGDRRGRFTALCVRLLRHAGMGEGFSRRLWEWAPEQELDDAGVSAFMGQVQQKVAALYLKHRESLRGELPPALGNPLLDPGESLRLALLIPEEFPEVHAFAPREVAKKLASMRTALIGHDPDSTPFLLEHVKPNGVVRESLLSQEAHDDVRTRPAGVPLKLEGLTETSDKILGIRPYTPSYRFSLLLLSMLGTDTHRLAMMGLNFNHAFKPEARRLATRGGNLLLAGAPPSWVVVQFATRYIEAYRAARGRVFEEVEKTCPSIYREIYFCLPEYDLLREALPNTILLGHGLNPISPSHRTVFEELRGLFKKYERLSLEASQDPSSPLGIEIADQTTRAFILHHQKFRNMLGLPEELHTLMNTWSLLMNESEMPELFRDSAAFDRVRQRVTPPSPVDVRSAIGQAYIRATLLMQTAADRAGDEELQRFMGTELPAIAREGDGVHTVLAALNHYFVHREKILASLAPLLR